MENLFIQRLKYAKRELTALKTSYVRALGMLKIYTDTVNVPSTGHQGGLWTVIVTVNFSQKFTAYPFVNVIPEVGNDFTHSMEFDTVEYSNNGYTAIFHLTWLYRSGAGTDVTIYATSPIENISIDWRVA